MKEVLVSVKRELQWKQVHFFGGGYTTLLYRYAFYTGSLNRIILGISCFTSTWFKIYSLSSPWRGNGTLFKHIPDSSAIPDSIPVAPHCLFLNMWLKIFI